MTNTSLVGSLRLLLIGESNGQRRIDSCHIEMDSKLFLRTMKFMVPSDDVTCEKYHARCCEQIQKELGAEKKNDRTIWPNVRGRFC